MSDSPTTVSATAAVRLLLVSANDDWGRSLIQYLQRNGYDAQQARSVPDAIQRMREARPSCLLIDRELPNVMPLRQVAIELNVILVTVQVVSPACSDDDCVTDYAAGSDAVICTPSPRELLARVRALLRREQFRTVAPMVYCAGDIEMNVGRHEVRVRGTLVELTRKEFQLLERLLASPHHVFTRQELMDQVWGENYALEPHGVDVHISALRRKVEIDPANPQMILTVRGRGYKIRSANEG